MRRLVALSIAGLLLAVGLVGLNVQRAAAAAQVTQATSAAASGTTTCILIIICFPTPGGSSGSASPTQSAAAPSAAPSPTASSGLLPAVGKLLPTTGSGGSTASPSPSATPAQPHNASAAAGLVSSDAAWTITATSAHMTGFTYQGVTNLPTAGGSVQVMEFTASSMTLANVVTTAHGNGGSETEAIGSFSASDVTMYATSLSGSLFGTIPVTFTPSTLTVANLLKLPNAGELKLTNLLTSSIPLTMTGITANQAVLLSAQSQLASLSIAG